MSTVYVVILHTFYL